MYVRFLQQTKMASLNSLSFDMISRTTIRHNKKNNIHVDIFINDYLQENIDQCNDKKRWMFVIDYVKNISMNIVDKIIQTHGNEKIINDLIKYYFETYKHMEFVFDKHINMIEQETDENIKRNMISLILFNVITYSSFLY